MCQAKVTPAELKKAANDLHNALVRNQIDAESHRLGLAALKALRKQLRAAKK